MNALTHLSLLTPMEQTIMELSKALYDPEIFKLVSLEEYRDAMSDGQLVSKDIVSMKLEYQTFRKPVVVGGWYGLMASMIAIYHDRPVVSLDISETATKVAGRVLGARGTAIQADAFNFDYKGYDLVVNTSTEHFTRPLSEWISMLAKGTLVVLQNNDDSSIPDHVQSFATKEEFQESVKLSEVLECLTVEFPQYKRHMIVGRT